MIEFRCVQGDKEIIHRVSDGLDIFELSQEIRCFLLAISYQPGSIDRILINEESL